MENGFVVTMEYEVDSQPDKPIVIDGIAYETMLKFALQLIWFVFTDAARAQYDDYPLDDGITLTSQIKILPAQKSEQG